MWKYEQSTGVLRNSAGASIALGYSGAPGAKNDPSKQSIVKVGPIPRGNYHIGAPFDSASHGPYCLRLTPDPANEMFGRDGFLIHGDSIEHPGAASEGCIILPRFIRQQIFASHDYALVVAQ